MQKQVDYLQASSTKYPEQVVIAIAKDENGKANPITLGWVMPTSENPPMIAISVSPKRYSAQTIRYSKCFTIAFPADDMAELALFFGTKSGRDIDKFAKCECTTQPAERIDSVLLCDAVANFECILESETISGDHIIFVGRVVASYANSQKKKRVYVVGKGYKMGSFS